MQFPLIGINVIGEIWLELPLFIISVPCMFYSLLDIRHRMLSQRHRVSGSLTSIQEEASV